MTSKRPTWTCSQTDTNAFSVKIPYKKNKSWEQYLLLTSDQHWDNPKSDHALQLKHLREAKERSAMIVSCGDYFCLMQGKFDKRSNKSAVRVEHQNDYYLDSVISTAVEFLKPYAQNYIMIARGNHESSIEERYEMSIIDRFVGILNHQTKSHIFNGTYSGFVSFNFSAGYGKGGTCQRIVMHYAHGSGGGAPMTADVLSSKRRAIWVDADIIVSGHTHTSLIHDYPKVGLSHTGNIKTSDVYHIKIPTYKNEYGTGTGGYAVAKKGMGPAALGAYWIRFFWSYEEGMIKFDIFRAQ